MPYLHSCLHSCVHSSLHSCCNKRQCQVLALNPTWASSHMPAPSLSKCVLLFGHHGMSAFMSACMSAITSDGQCWTSTQCGPHCTVLSLAPECTLAYATVQAVRTGIKAVQNTWPGEKTSSHVESSTHPVQEPGVGIAVMEAKANLSAGETKQDNKLQLLSFVSAGVDF